MTQKKEESASDEKQQTVDKPAVKPFGWLDRRRWDLQILEEQIEYARKMAGAKAGRGHDKQSRLEWTKALGKLLELHGETLAAIKIHLHGHTGPGSENDEPGEEQYGTTLFERKFRGFLMREWSPDDLKIQCQDCGNMGEDVWERTFYVKSKSIGWDTERFWLCSECNAKREATQPTEEQLEEDEE